MDGMSIFLYLEVEWELKTNAPRNNLYVNSMLSTEQ